MPLMLFNEDEFNRLKNRDPVIFEKLYKEYRDKVYNFIAIKSRGNQDLTEEVFCQTFYSALKSLPNLKNSKNILAWLLQIANCRYYDFLRAYYRNKKYQEMMPLETELANNTVEADLTKEEKIEMVKIAMQSIKPEYSQVLHLKYIEQKNQKEIAGILNKSVSAVESLLFKARKAVKNKLKNLL